MAKIKLTKTELKKQRDQHKQFTRFLPTLQLKKQQLQMEVRKVNEQMADIDREETAFLADLEAWVSLFASADFQPVYDLVEIESVKLGSRNIAGVDVPILEDLRYQVRACDFFTTPPWLDRAAEAAKSMVAFFVRRKVLERQRDLLEEELATTTQRVNLFEKVKIPECKRNIRTIQIYLGDQQTAAVGRAKIAKNKLTAAAEENE